MAFRFKQFLVNDDESTMRVGTDAIILGAWANLSNAQRVLDVGTGCGVLAIMAAQRCAVPITAIDIHTPSVSQANQNFRECPWEDRLRAVECSFQKSSSGILGEFDFILSNPPFFTRSLKSPVETRNLAKHDDNLSVDEFFRTARKILESTNTGSIAIIVPAVKSAEYCATGILHGFSLLRKMSVFPNPSKPANRVTLQFSSQPMDIPEISQLMIRDVNNLFTSEYMELTRNFYINF